jgi:Domain of unknown function (DUF1772)
MTIRVLQILSVLVVVLAVTPALAHALELPGKLRLSRDAYIAAQPMYYPGFTIAGGIGEAGGILLTLVLLFLLPFGSTAFWLTLVAVVGLAAMHAAYWILTHPVNKFWLQGEKLDRGGAGFFAFDPLKGARVEIGRRDWTSLRDRWEYSHVVRAGLAGLSLVSLVTATAL